MSTTPPSTTPPSTTPPSTTPPPGPSQPGTTPVGSAGSFWSRAGWVALATACTLLLADAAVETFLRGSPLRWIVVIIVAAALGLSGLAYRRWKWPGAAVGGLLTLLGLLALTAWLPDGAERGVALLGQPSPAVLAGTCALALLLAAGMFALARIVPLPVRAALALLALYGAAAFVQGAIRSAPFTDLFHGQSLWTRLPWWLQGAVVGGIVILPLALIGHVVLTLVRPRRLWGSALAATAWGMVIVLVISGMRVPSGTAPAASGPQAATQATPSPQPAAPATPAAPPAASSQTAPAGTSPEELEKARKDYQEARARLQASLDYSWLDVQAAQAKIGTDPVALAKFVQTEIRYEPYAGALRGPRGTLLARAGNSLDRALLLAAMLRAAGHRVRFAEGTLSPAQAEQLVRAAFPPRPPAFKSGSALMTITQRSLQHFLFLGNTLHEARFRPPEGDAGVWTTTVEEARRHFWVQVESGDRWLDLDTSPGVAYGRSLVPAAAQRDEPDAELFPAVEIRVEVEAIRDGRRELRTVLRHTARTADLAGVPIGMFHERRPDASIPVLMVGERRITGESFQSPVFIGVGKARAPVLNPFGGGGDRLNAEWLKFRVIAPSGEREAAYTIADIDGPAVRQSGAPPKEITAENTQAVLDALDAFVGIGIATGDTPPAFLWAMVAEVTDPQSEAGVVRLLALMASTYHAIRGRLPSSFLTPRPLWYVDSPYIVVVRAQPHAAPTPATISMDLTLKGYRLLRGPDDPFAQRGPFYDHLVSGVLDHTAERWLLGTEQAAASVGALFETAAAQKVPARVMKAAGEIPSGLLTEDGRLRLAGSLGRGQIVVLPESRPKDWKPLLGWWSVDQKTGWTEDTTEEGGHQTAPEYGTSTRSIAVVNAERVKTLGCVVAGAAIMAVGAYVFKTYTDRAFSDSGSRRDLDVAFGGGTAAIVGYGIMTVGCWGSSTPPAGGSGAPPGAGGAPPAAPAPPRGPFYGPPAGGGPPRFDPRMTWREPSLPYDPTHPELPTAPGLPYAPTHPQLPTAPGFSDTIPEMPTLPWGP
jgi:transglutaminase-like putative cysteine protease